MLPVNGTAISLWRFLSSLVGFRGGAARASRNPLTPPMLPIFGLCAALVVPAGTRTIGSLKVSEVGLGTLNLPLGEEQSPAAAAALASAVGGGCNFVDVRGGSSNSRDLGIAPAVGAHCPSTLLLSADCGGLRVWHVGEAARLGRTGGRHHDRYR